MIVRCERRGNVKWIIAKASELLKGERRYEWETWHVDSGCVLSPLPGHVALYFTENFRVNRRPEKLIPWSKTCFLTSHASSIMIILKVVLVVRLIFKKFYAPNTVRRRKKPGGVCRLYAFALEAPRIGIPLKWRERHNFHFTFCLGGFQWGYFFASRTFYGKIRD